MNDKNKKETIMTDSYSSLQNLNFQSKQRDNQQENPNIKDNLQKIEMEQEKNQQNQQIIQNEENRDYDLQSKSSQEMNEKKRIYKKYIKFDKKCKKLIKNTKNTRCEFCRKNFSNRYNLKTHVLKVHNLEPELCLKCKQRFKNKHELKIHIEIYHFQKSCINYSDNSKVELTEEQRAEMVRKYSENQLKMQESEKQKKKNCILKQNLDKKESVEFRDVIDISGSFQRNLSLENESLDQKKKIGGQEKQEKSEQNNQNKSGDYQLKQCMWKNMNYKNIEQNCEKRVLQGKLSRVQNKFVQKMDNKNEICKATIFNNQQEVQEVDIQEQVNNLFLRQKQCNLLDKVEQEFVIDTKKKLNYSQNIEKSELQNMDNKDIRNTEVQQNYDLHGIYSNKNKTNQQFSKFNLEVNNSHIVKDDKSNNKCDLKFKNKVCGTKIVLFNISNKNQNWNQNLIQQQGIQCDCIGYDQQQLQQYQKKQGQNSYNKKLMENKQRQNFVFTFGNNKKQQDQDIQDFDGFEIERKKLFQKNQQFEKNFTENNCENKILDVNWNQQHQGFLNIVDLNQYNQYIFQQQIMGIQCGSLKNYTDQYKRHKIKIENIKDNHIECLRNQMAAKNMQHKDTDQIIQHSMNDGIQNQELNQSVQLQDKINWKQKVQKENQLQKFSQQQCNDFSQIIEKNQVNQKELFQKFLKQEMQSFDNINCQNINENDNYKKKQIERQYTPGENRNNFSYQVENEEQKEQVDSINLNVQFIKQQYNSQEFKDDNTNQQNSEKIEKNEQKSFKIIKEQENNILEQFGKEDKSNQISNESKQDAMKL